MQSSAVSVQSLTCAFVVAHLLRSSRLEKQSFWKAFVLEDFEFEKQPFGEAVVLESICFGHFYFEKQLVEKHWR